MKIFEQLERRRQWNEEEQAILDAGRRVAEEHLSLDAAAGRLVRLLEEVRKKRLTAREGAAS